MSPALENPREFIEEYFTQTLHLKSHRLDEYTTDKEGIRIMWLSAAGSMKTILQLENKETCISKLSKMGIPCPDTLGFIRKESDTLIWEDKRGTKSDLRQLLEQEGRVFVKPTDGYYGRGCLLLEKLDGTYVIANDERITFTDLAGRINKDLQIEKVLTNHPDLARFHKASLNTLRLITMKGPNNGIYLDRAVLRMGINGKHTDNWCTGGLAVRIMPDGTLDQLGLYEDPSMAPTEFHPNSKIVFHGQKVPFYNEAVDLVLSIHRHFSRINGLGFDVAITENGPLVVEINPFFSLFQPQCGGVRKMYYKRYLPQALRYAELTDQIL